MYCNNLVILYKKKIRELRRNTTQLGWAITKIFMSLYTYHESNYHETDIITISFKLTVTVLRTCSQLL